MNLCVPYWKSWGKLRESRALECGHPVIEQSCLIHYHSNWLINQPITVELANLLVSYCSNELDNTDITCDERHHVDDSDYYVSYSL